MSSLSLEHHHTGSVPPATRRLRIALVVHDYSRGWGHGRYVVELATRFAAQHDVHVFANTTDQPTCAGITFHHVPAWRASALLSILSFIAPATLVARDGFDIIHSQGLCGLRYDVLTAHICNKAWYEGNRSVHEPTWKARLFQGLVGTLEHGLYRYTPAHKHVIAISQQVADDLTRHYRCRAPAHVVYHGVDTETFRPGDETLRRCVRERLRVGSEEQLFLIVGDLRKGAHQCLRALATVPGAKLAIVSRTAPEPYQSMAAELGVLSRALFLGATNDVKSYYTAADAFLLPTPYDSFAMVVTEAMACGLPVIVSTRAGAAELVRHGSNGLLLQDPADYQELANHMNSLMRDRSWAHSLGVAARATVETHTWDHVAKATMAVYEQVLAGRARGGGW